MACVDAGEVMAELFVKEAGSCTGTGGSMHIFDKPTYFQGGWALVAKQLPYAAGAAKSILLDRALALFDNENFEKQDVALRRTTTEYPSCSSARAVPRTGVRRSFSTRPRRTTSRFSSS